VGLLDALKGLLDGPQVKPRAADPLGDVVREHMPGDEDVQRVVVAIAGLLACVAYADQEYHPKEEEMVRSELSRVHGLSAEAVDAICAVLASKISVVVAAGDYRWVRDLRELTGREQRLEILELLLELAAADEEFSMTEANYLRRLTTALGLEQADYNAAQARHRDKLTTLG
jgi:uncharacterized tellurite resistance protein B-like protein